MDDQGTSILTECIYTYLKARRLAGYSERTLYSYKLHLQHLEMEIGHTTKVSEIRLEHLRTHLASFPHLQASSLANKIRAVKVFFRWLHEDEILERNPALKLREPKMPVRIPKALSIEEVELLRDACESLLEHALVEFFFATGCRVGEIYRLNRADLNWVRRSAIVTGKGGKER